MNIKKFFLTLIMMSSFSTPLLSQNSFWDTSGLSVTARVAYFHPASSKVRDIYSNGWADYQIEIGKEFCNNLQLWVGVSGFSQNGRSIISGLSSSYDSFFDFSSRGDKTSISFIPVYLGLKYFFPITCQLKAYIGAAGLYGSLRIKDHSHYVHEHVDKKGFGGLVQIGLNYYFDKCFFLNVFGDYLFQHFDFSNDHHSSYYYVERNDLNLNGYKVGAGIGFTF
ncbi:MAG: hypothetical protein Q8K60_01955 [Parachlamydiaceae bacterium]|nr:hypothetical protein [Parachlamydiaceae bacterium]